MGRNLLIQARPYGKPQFQENLPMVILESVLPEVYPDVSENTPVDPSPEDRHWAAQAFADADFSHYPDECPELDEWAYYEPEEPADDHPHDSFLGGMG